MSGTADRALGPDEVDWLATIVEWVEHQHAPDRIVARKLDEDRKVIMTRPLYPYPQRAVYRGTGSLQDAANFVSDRDTVKR